MKRIAATFAATAIAAALGGSPGAQGFTIYVSNEKDNTVTVVDGEKLEVIATIKVRRPPARHHRDQGRQVHLCSAPATTTPSR